MPKIFGRILGNVCQKLKQFLNLHFAPSFLHDAIYYKELYTAQAKAK